MIRVGIQVTVGTKGQVVIPIDIRRAIGLEPGQKVDLALEEDRVVMRAIPRDLIAALTGSLRGGRSMLEDLKREHAEEVQRDEERCAG